MSSNIFTYYTEFRRYPRIDFLAISIILSRTSAHFGFHFFERMICRRSHQTIHQHFIVWSILGGEQTRLMPSQLVTKLDLRVHVVAVLVVAEDAVPRHVDGPESGASGCGRSTGDGDQNRTTHNLSNFRIFLRFQQSSATIWKWLNAYHVDNFGEFWILKKLNQIQWEDGKFDEHLIKHL